MSVRNRAEVLITIL